MHDLRHDVCEHLSSRAVFDGNCAVIDVVADKMEPYVHVSRLALTDWVVRYHYAGLVVLHYVHGQSDVDADRQESLICSEQFL